MNRKMVLGAIFLFYKGEKTEKATLFYTKFIKCFLLRADSLSDWGLVVKTAVNAMMIPPVNVVLCFKG